MFNYFIRYDKIAAFFADNNIDCRPCYFGNGISDRIDIQFILFDSVQIVKTHYFGVFCLKIHLKRIIVSRANNGSFIVCDNFDAIKQYKLNIDSVRYSVSEIARAAIDIIVGKKSGNFTVAYKIIEHKA